MQLALMLILNRNVITDVCTRLAVRSLTSLTVAQIPNVLHVLSRNNHERLMYCKDSIGVSGTEIVRNHHLHAYNMQP